MMKRNFLKNLEISRQERLMIRKKLLVRWKKKLKDTREIMINYAICYIIIFKIQLHKPSMIMVQTKMTFLIDLRFLVNISEKSRIIFIIEYFIKIYFLKL